MNKSLLLFAVCLGVALSRPSNLETDNVVLDKSSTDKGNNTENWFEKLADILTVSFVSLGKVDNDPAQKSGLGGETYHNLAFNFGTGKDYRIYVDHQLDEFKEGDGGTLGIGYESPVPYVGRISVRAAESFNSPGNGSFNWRLNMNNQAWRKEE